VRSAPDDITETLAGLAIFADLSRPELERVAHTLEERYFAQDERVLRQGLSGSGFYIVLEGEAAALADGRRVNVLGRGDFFGEISADESAGGMFRRWPFFQRLLSWTKPYAPFERGSREYERYDWNSLLPEEADNRALMTTIMDGTSYYPSRPEMERNLATFAERTKLAVRYGCRWTTTRRDDDRWVLETTDGEYRCQVPIFAVGVSQPWRPAMPGIEDVPHYADTRPAETYAGKRVFIIGKENSGFELATGFLQWAKQIVLASPSAAKLSINTRSLVGVRARYVQPYEDHVLAGGVIVLDASIERIERTGAAYRVHTRPSDGSRAPELWHQKSYLARVLIRDEKRGILDDGILPLQHFLDSGPADAVAATLEENPAGDIYPVLYTRRGGASTEHDLAPNPLHDFRTREPEAALVDALTGLFP